MSNEPVRETAFDAAWQMVQAGHKAALATVISTSGSSPRPVGAQLAIRDDGYFVGSVSGGCVEGAVIAKAQDSFHNPRPQILHYGVQSDNPFDVGMACGGAIDILLEPIGEAGLPVEYLQKLALAEREGRACVYQIDLRSFEREIVTSVDASGLVDGVFMLHICPPKRLFIIGAVHIAQYLIPMAQLVGFEVFLIDNREIFGHAARFHDVNFQIDWPTDVLKNAKLDRSSAVVTLTHDDKFDIPALAVACASEAFYIGALGSRKTQETRNNALRDMGVDVEKIHGPVGLSIGAKTPAEIALSIMSEIVLEMRNHG